MDTDNKTASTFFDFQISQMELNIAEIYFDSGIIKFRYSRYLSSDNSRWIRHGLFNSFYENGTLASEGEYENGFENGLWQYWHENGQLAAKGKYVNGKESGAWKHWDSNGDEEPDSISND